MKTSGLIAFQTTLIADLFAAQHDICINLKTTGNTFPTSGKFEETILFFEIDFWILINWLKLLHSCAPVSNENEFLESFSIWVSQF